MLATAGDLHAQALERYAEGATDEAIELLRDAVTQGLDPELVNDLAVMLAGAGRTEEARALLLGLLRLAPDYEAAAENLASLPGAGAGGAPGEIPGAAEWGVQHGSVEGRFDDMAAAGAQFLQLVSEASATRLIDNLDRLFFPMGHPLPDPALAGERLATQMAVLDRCGVLWRNIGDQQSRDLLLRFFAYRALGPAHVRLQLEPEHYHRSVAMLTAKTIREAGVMFAPGAPFEWQLHRYDLQDTGIPVQVIGSALPLASTYLFSQYAYRDAATGALPRRGDVVIDGGGCWGETALWLAHMVGESGQVHSFEPGPKNLELLQRNLAANPQLAQRIAVHDVPLGAVAGETLWIEDALAPGAGLKNAEEMAGKANMVETQIETVDAIVARGELSTVDFIKLDVEHAELAVIKGASETIRTQRPRLAISIYHRPDDLATIPAAIERLGVSYRWYLQCSTMNDIDTVAFGVPV
jgi:FkbM family methyltransferase